MDDLDGSDEEPFDFPTKKLKALYDYSYKDDYGHMVSMEAGEEYHLLQKSGDWWEVIRTAGDTSDLSFYVPANYVEFVDPCDEGGDSKTKGSNDSAEANPGSGPSTHNTSGSCTPSQDGDKHLKTDDNSNMKMDYSNGNNELYVNAQTLHQAVEQNRKDKLKPELEHIISIRHGYRRTLSEDDAGEYANLEDLRNQAGMGNRSPPEPPPDYDHDIYINFERPDQKHTSNRDAIYANTQELLQSTPDEVPTAEMGIYKKTLLKVWDVYALPSNPNRWYYINKETKERTWKPPRPSKRMAPTPPGLTQIVKTTPPVIPDVRINRSSSDMPGWTTEQSDAGLFFINNTTKEKWSTSTDANGKTYFYNVDTNDTAWQLPQISPTSNGDLKSRHEPSFPEGNRKSPQVPRSVKSQSMYLESQLNFANPHGGNILCSRTLPANSSAPQPRQSGGIVKSSTLPYNLNSADQQKTPLHQPQQHQQMEKICGTLKRKLVVEGGKQVKKSQSSSFVRVLGTNMVFYKDRKSATAQQGQQHGKPEFMEPLQGALVEKHHSKKNVLVFITCNKNKYQLQLDDEKEMQTWLTALQLTINELGPGSLDSAQQQILLAEDEPVKRTPSFKKGRKSVSNDDSQDSLDKKNTRTKLLKLLKGRSSKEVLEEKEIIKYSVFGAQLKQICDKDKSKVPKFVTRCIAAIEKRGLDQDGLYRISGNLAQITKLRSMVDHTDTYDLDSEEMWDIHVLSGALKLFFRELKEPLFVYVLFDKFINAISKKTNAEKMKQMKDAVNSLPKVNHETLKFLCAHLLKVADTKESRMSIPNLAIVFGPTLIWKEGDLNFMAHMVLQSQIVEYILLEFKTIFK